MEHKNKPVIIVEYDPNWPIEFQKISKVIEDKLGDLISTIEHVGSTSVPGLMAKPIIDINIVIDSERKLPKVIEKLSELGYIYEGDLGIVGREAFDRENDKVPYSKDDKKWLPQHLYVCIENNKALQRHLAFRDYLRKNPDAAREYGKLKKGLSDKFKHDRSSYTEAKTNFIEGILNKAMK